jgi:hypothetical protein
MAPKAYLGKVSLEVICRKYFHNHFSYREIGKDYWTTSKYNLYKDFSKNIFLFHNNKLENS